LPRNNCNKCGKPAGFNPNTGVPNKLCKSCFQKQKDTSKNSGQARPKSTVRKSEGLKQDYRNKNKATVAKSIDIESIYRGLKTALEKRAGYQEAQQNLWKYIKRTNADRSHEMKQISDEIGTNTHEINKILNELTQYKKTHKAMNMADRYLQSEISRIQKIIEDWKKTVRDVEAGRKILISSNGVNHTNTTGAKEYIQIKQRQLSNLQKWQNHVRHYMVK